jgi:hypothetical protein
MLGKKKYLKLINITTKDSKFLALLLRGLKLILKAGIKFIYLLTMKNIIAIFSFREIIKYLL